MDPLTIAVGGLATVGWALIMGAVIIGSALLLGAAYVASKWVKMRRAEIKNHYALLELEANTKELNKSLIAEKEHAKGQAQAVKDIIEGHNVKGYLPANYVFDNIQHFALTNKKPSIPLTDFFKSTAKEDNQREKRIDALQKQNTLLSTRLDEKALDREDALVRYDEEELQKAEAEVRQLKKLLQ